MADPVNPFARSNPFAKQPGYDYGALSPFAMQNDEVYDNPFIPQTFNPFQPPPDSDEKLVPFDSRVHEPQDVGFGGPSTEYHATENAPDGTVFNYPQIWWGEDGNPVPLKGRAAMDQALRYEQETGQKFPRFTGVDNATAIRNAVEAANNRSRRNGAASGPLMGSMPYWSP